MLNQLDKLLPAFIPIGIFILCEVFEGLLNNGQQHTYIVAQGHGLFIAYDIILLILASPSSLGIAIINQYKPPSKINNKELTN